MAHIGARVDERGGRPESNAGPPQFGRRIVTTGRRIVCTDPEADHAFVRDVQLRAADLEPFLRRMRRLKLDAIGR